MALTVRAGQWLDLRLIWWRKFLDGHFSNIWCRSQTFHFFDVISDFRSDDVFNILPMWLSENLLDMWCILIIVGSVIWFFHSFYSPSIFLIPWVIQGSSSFGFLNLYGICSLTSWFHLYLNKSLSSFTLTYRYVFDHHCITSETPPSSITQAPHILKIWSQIVIRKYHNVHLLYITKLCPNIVVNTTYMV